MKAKHITVLIILVAVIFITLGIIRGSRLYKQDNNTQLEQAAQNTSLLPTATQKNDSCIITISGNRYDVTNFRYVHEGGNVFRCGEDMTEVFKKAHGGYLKMIEKFKVN